MSVNKEALRATLEAVKANPDHWDQTVWVRKTACGTAYCFAGWTCVLDGFTEPVDRTTWLVRSDGLSVDVQIYAKRRLGLTWQQADGLFDQFNTLADLERIVSELCEDPT